MLYYRVLPQYDQRCKNPRVRNGNIYIGNELYTPREVERQKLNMKYLELVNVSKRSVYFFFGARFSDEIAHYNN